MTSTALLTSYFPELDSLLEPLINKDSNRTTLISLCGAGGKTSTLFRLADYFAKRGKRVLITTTTRMYLPPPSPRLQLCLEAEPQRQWALGKQHAADGQPGCIMALFDSMDEESGKVRGLPPSQLDRLKGAGLDLILVEADGAQRKPFKVPAAHEPCIPATSDIVITLTGAAVIDAPADPDRIHRWPQLEALCGIAAGDPLSWPLLDALLAHPEGLFKGSPPQARRIWFINGDYQNEMAWRPELEQLMRRHPELHAVWQGAVREANPIRYALSRSSSGPAIGPAQQQSVTR